MIKKDDDCWIKVVPLIRMSIPSSLHFILNDEYYHLDVYDENGRESHEIYFVGFNRAFSFYLKSGENCYRIDCDNDNIKVIPIIETHSLDNYIKVNCNNNLSQASCWARAVYYTSRPDKSPFNQI
jgi:hypothetical protein